MTCSSSSCLSACRIELESLRYSKKKKKENEQNHEFEHDVVCINLAPELVFKCDNNVNLSI
jgi:hypothetical protein